MFLFFVSYVFLSAIVYYKKADCDHCLKQLNLISTKNLNIEIKECDNSFCDVYIYKNKSSPNLTTILDHLIIDDNNKDYDNKDYDKDNVEYDKAFVYTYTTIDSRLLEMLQILSLEFQDVRFIRKKGHTHSLIGYHNGLIQEYRYILTISSIRLWLHTLFSKIQPLTHHTYKPDTNFFVVFYMNIYVVKQFDDIHHRHRFNFKIYRSDDPKLMHLAGVHLDDINMCVLGVYKDRVWHKLKLSYFNEKVVERWMMDVQYPHVTVINDSNQHVIMDGHRVAVIMVVDRNMKRKDNEDMSINNDKRKDDEDKRKDDEDKRKDDDKKIDNDDVSISEDLKNDLSITDNKSNNDVFIGLEEDVSINYFESLVEKFENLSSKLHSSKLFINAVFAILTEDSHDIIKRFDLIIPSIVLYDPNQKKFYYENVDMENIKNMEIGVLKLIKAHEDGRLQELNDSLYKVKKKRGKRGNGFYVWVIMIIAILGVVGVVCGSRQRKKYKIQ